MRKKNVHLTDLEWKLLEDESQRTGLKTAELIRRAIDEYLERCLRKKTDELQNRSDRQTE